VICELFSSGFKGEPLSLKPDTEPIIGPGPALFLVTAAGELLSESQPTKPGPGPFWAFIPA